MDMDYWLFIKTIIVQCCW